MIVERDGERILFEPRGDKAELALVAVYLYFAFYCRRTPTPEEVAQFLTLVRP